MCRVDVLERQNNYLIIQNDELVRYTLRRPCITSVNTEQAGKIDTLCEIVNTMGRNRHRSSFVEIFHYVPPKESLFSVWNGVSSTCLV
jgi:hypothetical protein